jgi:hypothetical protein
MTTPYSTTKYREEPIPLLLILVGVCGWGALGCYDLCCNVVDDVAKVVR